jgi:hypothetical protein
VLLGVHLFLLSLCGRVEPVLQQNSNSTEMWQQEQQYFQR